MTTIPSLETERLILREPKPDDFGIYAKYMASDRSGMNGGPLNRDDAWKALALVIGHWTMRGYGSWHAEEKSSGELVGCFGFWHPEGVPEREIGWVVYDGFEGKGYAFEASKYLLEYARDSMGWPPLTSVIAPDNIRSIALAERLGAHFEEDWVSPSGKPSLIYRHSHNDS